MTKRARYDGPYEEVAVYDAEHEDGVHAGPVAVVQRGHLLPDDVRAPIRDELIKGGYWSEVNQADQKKSDSDPKADAKTPTASGVKPDDKIDTKKDGS